MYKQIKFMCKTIVEKTEKNEVIQKIYLLTNELQMADRDPNEMEDVSCLYGL